MVLFSNKSESKDSTALEKHVESAKASSSETWLGELWHSTKYAFVQNSYDAIKQDVNHMAGAFSTGAAPMPDRQLVEPMHWRKDQSSIGVAQEIGAAIGTAPFAVAVHVGLRKLLPELAFEKSMPVSSIGAAEKTRNVLRTAMTGGIIGGALTPVADDDHWGRNKLKSATTGFAAFATAASGMEFFGGGQLSSRLTVSGNGRPGELLRNSLGRAENFAVATGSGGIANIVGNETSSIIFDHKLSSTSDMTKNGIKTAALMATLSALQPAFGRTLTEKVQGTPVNEVHAPRGQAQIPKAPERTTYGAKPTEEEASHRTTKPTPESDMQARPDVGQALRLEEQAKALSDKGQYAESATRLHVALDCLEGAKSLGVQVDEAHLAQLYKTIAATNLKADKP